MQRRGQTIRRTGWYVLVRWAATGIVVVQGAVAIARTDAEAGLATVALVVGLLLLRWRRVVGLVVLGLLFANHGFWTVLAALSNVRNGEAFLDSMLPALIGTLSLVGLVSAVVELFFPPSPTSMPRGPRVVALAAIALLLVAVVASLVGPDGASAQPGDVRVVTRDLDFAPETLEIGPGRTAIFASNSELFWHTFTVTELDVDLRVPPGGERRTEFDARPGTYEYVCTIPGHAQAGMKGTLLVR